MWLTDYLNSCLFTHSIATQKIHISYFNLARIAPWLGYSVNDMYIAKEVKAERRSEAKTQPGTKFQLCKKDW